MTFRNGLSMALRSSSSLTVSGQAAIVLDQRRWGSAA